MIKNQYKRKVLEGNLLTREEARKLAKENTADLMAAADEIRKILCGKGSGGIVCPISMGKERIMLVDIIKELNLTTILVSEAGLGTLNSSILTLEYMKLQNIKVSMIMLNNYDAENVIHIENKKFLVRESGLPIYIIQGKGILGSVYIQNGLAAK
jgi:dethiobiotin synthetase